VTSSCHRLEECAFLVVGAHAIPADGVRAPRAVDPAEIEDHADPIEVHALHASGSRR